MIRTGPGCVAAFAQGLYSDYTVNAAGNHGPVAAPLGRYLYGTNSGFRMGQGATEYLKYVRLINGKYTSPAP